MHACTRTTTSGHLFVVASTLLLNIARLAVIYEVDLLRRGAVAYEDPGG